MAMQLMRWERRDTADRVAFGEAAYALCRAAKTQDGMKTSRFYWTGADGIVILNEAESQHVFDDPPKPDLAAAMFNLADLARGVETERWIDPRDGQTTHRTAGR